MHTDFAVQEPNTNFIKKVVAILEQGCGTVYKNIQKEVNGESNSLTLFLEAKQMVKVIVIQTVSKLEPLPYNLNYFTIDQGFTRRES